MKCSSSEREISIWRCVIRRKRKEQDPRRNLITVIGYIVSSLDHDSARKWTKRTSHEYYTMIFPENGVLLLLELLYNSTINTAIPCSLDFFFQTSLISSLSNTNLISRSRSTIDSTKHCCFVRDTN